MNRQQLTIEAQRLLSIIDGWIDSGSTPDEAAQVANLFGFSKEAQAAVVAHLEERDRQEARHG